MQFNTVRTFFLKGEEHEAIQAIDPFVIDDLPHYELEDESIIYAHAGVDPKTGAYRIWYANVQKPAPRKKIITEP